MQTRSDERRQMRCQEAALAVANERLFEQALELEALELANDEIIRQAGQAVQEVSMASSVCFIMTGFFAAWTQFYTVVQPNPGRAVVTAGMSLLAAWIGRRLHSRPAWLGICMDNSITMETMICILGQLGASAQPEESANCKAAVNVLYAFLDEGAKTLEDVLDIIHDYRLQAKQNVGLRKKHLLAEKPFLKDSVWHCPDCNRWVSPNHSFCHCCGKKLRWR